MARDERPNDYNDDNRKRSYQDDEVGRPDKRRHEDEGKGRGRGRGRGDFQRKVDHRGRADFPGSGGSPPVRRGFQGRGDFHARGRDRERGNWYGNKEGGFDRGRMHGRGNIQGHRCLPSDNRAPPIAGQIPRKKDISYHIEIYQPLPVVVVAAPVAAENNDEETIDTNDRATVPPVVQVEPSTSSAKNDEPIGAVDTKSTVMSKSCALNWCDDMKWDDMSHEQRIRYLTPRSPTSHGTYIPDESFFNKVFPLVHDAPSEKRLEKMKLAVIAAKEAITSLFRQMQANDVKSDSDDSEKGYSSDESVPAISGITERQGHQFVEKLPLHLLFTASFDARGTDTSESKLCICPCSAKNSGQWLKMVHLRNVASSAACHGKFEHFALLAHMESKGSIHNQGHLDPLHVGIRAYLFKLYSCHYELENGKALDHEALLINRPRSRPLLEQVKAFRNRRRENKLADLRKEIEEYRSNYDRALRMTREEKEELRLKREICDKLGLTGKEVPANGLTTSEIKRIEFFYRKFMHVITASTQGCAQACEHRDAPPCFRIKSEDIPQPFNLNRLFASWSGTKPDKSFLFCNLKEESKGKLLRSGMWNFKDQVESSVDKGVDEGGLTRVFLGKVWDQIHELSVHELSVSEEKMEINLFAFPKGDAYCTPIPNDMIESQLEKVMHKYKENALSQVKRYYRAVGRLMLHSLATGHVLPNQLMSPFFRDCDGISFISTQDKIVLFGHLQQMGTPLSALTFYFEKECGKDQDKFLQHLDASFLGERSIALSSILSGLVLAVGPVITASDRIDEDPYIEEATTDLRSFFFNQNIQAVNEILFESASLSAELVIVNLKAVRLIDGRLEPLLINAKENEMAVRFMEQTLPNLLRRKECEEVKKGETKSIYVRTFVTLVTGLGFMNPRSPYINICFIKPHRDHHNHCARPVAHTCEQSLDIPLSAYDCNEATLEEFLEESFSQGAEVTTS